jgi:hypothetical protein
LHAKPRKYRSGLAKQSEPVFGHAAIGMPDVVAGQVDVVSAERRQVTQESRIRRSTGLQGTDGALQINSIPKGDCDDDQVEAAGSVALVLEGPVPDFAESIEEHGVGQRIACLSFIQTGVDPSA